MVLSYLWFLLALDGKGALDHNSMVLLQLLSAQQDDELSLRKTGGHNWSGRISNIGILLSRGHAFIGQSVVTILNYA